MELNLEEALEGPVDLSHVFDVPAERLERPDILRISPVQFVGRLQQASKGFLLEGQITLEGMATCSRCLADVPFTSGGEVTWTFAPVRERAAREAARGKGAPKPASGKAKAKGRDEDDDDDEASLASDELDLIYYDDLVLPFDPLIEEEVQLGLPMKPLCKQTCKGLCPTCGADRNITTCSCDTPTGTDRWKALAALVPGAKPKPND